GQTRMGTYRERRPLRLRPREFGPAVGLVLAATAILHAGSIAWALMPDDPPASTSYDQVSPVLLGKETLRDRMARDKAQKAEGAARQKQLLESRYDLTPKPDAQVRMSR